MQLRDKKLFQATLDLLRVRALLAFTILKSWGPEIPLLNSL